MIDAHAPASLLKLWYRELYEPLIPDALYGPCVAAGCDYSAATRALQRLPPLNRLVSAADSFYTTGIRSSASR